jgi:hypothetical protein
LIRSETLFTTKCSSETSVKPTSMSSDPHCARRAVPASPTSGDLTSILGGVRESEWQPSSHNRGGSIWLMYC